MSRRQFLVSAGAAALALPVACSLRDGREAVLPSDPAVAARERRRGAGAGRVVRHSLIAGPLTLDLAGRSVPTWGYDGGPIRVSAGDTLEVTLQNDLPEATTVHWHGIALRNDMDGVNDLTQPAVARGKSFTYRFVVPDAGTYFFHPHTGLQLDRSLYQALVVDDPADPGDVDADHTLILDDWLDGTPEDAFAALGGGKGMGGMGGMGGMDMGDGESMDMAGGASSKLLGGHAGDVTYAMHLINHRPPEDPATFDVPAGGRARLRLINAASDTAYRVAIGGHRLTVTHADGFPVEPVEVDALLMGMGERYDVVVTAAPGAHPIVALAEGKEQRAVAVLRAGPGEAPPAGATPAELEARLLRYGDLRPLEAVRLPAQEPDASISLDLTGSEAGYQWGFNGKAMDDTEPFEVEQGQTVRLRFRNRSSMWHPMHLHGHTFALAPTGARKDTVNVLPNQRVDVTFVADNPGQWMVHCHNTYHLEAGMAGVVSYVR